MLNSDYRPLCQVQLPFAGRQHYMHAFDLAAPVMRPGFEDYAEPVRALCAAAGATSGIAYMTVDEKIVRAGWSQRRPNQSAASAASSLSPQGEVPAEEGTHLLRPGAGISS